MFGYFANIRNLIILIRVMGFLTIRPDTPTTV